MSFIRSWKFWLWVVGIMICIVLVWLSGIQKRSNTVSLLIKPTNNWHRYENSRYGFAFNYPPEFSDAEEYPNDGQKECAPDTLSSELTIQDVMIFSAKNISVSIICEPLTSKLINQDDQPYNEKYTSSTLIIGGKKAYQDTFFTATNYFWKIVRIPLNTNHYIELGYAYKPSGDSSDYIAISEEDWTTMLASIKITAISG